MPKDLENDPFGKAVPHEDDDDEGDESEDEDYNPDAENDSAGSEISEDDEVDDDNDTNDGKSKKKFLKGSDESVTTNGGGDTSKQTNSTSKLIELDDKQVELAWKKLMEEDDDKEKEQKVETKVVTKQYDFAGQTVVVKEEVKVSNIGGESSATSNGKTESPESAKPSTTSNAHAAASTARPPVKRGIGGLSSVMAQLGKKPKMSTLTKSLHDWNEYKKTQNLEEELDQHRRSKNSFLERQAFLDRTDLREFEREKSIRDHERKMRQLNSKPN